jgi:hypothetical protein
MILVVIRAACQEVQYAPNQICKFEMEFFDYIKSFDESIFLHTKYKIQQLDLYFDLNLETTTLATNQQPIVGHKPLICQEKLF